MKVFYLSFCCFHIFLSFLYACLKYFNRLWWKELIFRKRWIQRIVISAEPFDIWVFFKMPCSMLFRSQIVFSIGPWYWREFDTPFWGFSWILNLLVLRKFFDYIKFSFDWYMSCFERIWICLLIIWFNFIQKHLIILCPKLSILP